MLLFCIMVMDLHSESFRAGGGGENEASCTFFRSGFMHWPLGSLINSQSMGKHCPLVR